MIDCENRLAHGFAALVAFGFQRVAQRPGGRFQLRNLAVSSQKRVMDCLGARLPLGF